MGEGSSRGSGWTSFDLDFLAEPTANENERGEEVAQSNPPNALNNSVAYPGEALPQAPAQAEGAQPNAPYPYQKNEIIGGVWNPLRGGFSRDSPLLPPMSYKHLRDSLNKFKDIRQSSITTNKYLCESLNAFKHVSQCHLALINTSARV